MPQIVYETNVDYAQTYDSLYRCSSLASIEQTRKSGLIWFRFENTNTIFLITQKGKMIVKWKDIDEKKVLLKLVEGLLIPETGQKLTIQPSKQQTWIPYPPPEPLKLYWCDEETTYSKKPNPILKDQVKHAEDLLVHHSYREFWHLMEVLRNEPQVKPLFDDSFKQSALKNCRQVTWTGQLTGPETHELIAQLNAHLCT